MRLFALWADIDTYGPASLYRQLFLPASVQAPAEVFNHIISGSLVASTETFEVQRTALVEAFNLADEDFEPLLRLAQLAPDTSLSLSGISKAFRYHLVGQAIENQTGGTGFQLLRLKQLTDLFEYPASHRYDPFRLPALLRFADDLTVLKSTGLKTSEHRLPALRRRSDRKNCAPTMTRYSRSSGPCAKALPLIEFENTAEEDPEGKITASKMAPVFTKDAVEQYFEFLRRRHFIRKSAMYIRSILTPTQHTRMQIS